jgi:uncharacterized protein YacL
MKNIFLKAILMVVLVVGFIEATDLGFWLMTQPSTFMFFSGVIINTISFVILTFVSVGIIQEVYEKIEKKIKQNKKNKTK